MPLAHHFVALICRDLGRAPLRISRQAAETLRRHDWPGNIRELRNVVERAIIMSKGDRLRLDRVMSESHLVESTSAASGATEDDFLTDAEMRELEKANLLKALRQAKWRISGESGAAELLELKPSTLTYRMRVFGIEN